MPAMTSSNSMLTISNVKQPASPARSTATSQHRINKSIHPTRSSPYTKRSLKYTPIRIEALLNSTTLRQTMASGKEDALERERVLMAAIGLMKLAHGHSWEPPHSIKRPLPRKSLPVALPPTLNGAGSRLALSEPPSDESRRASFSSTETVNDTVPRQTSVPKNSKKKVEKASPKGKAALKGKGKGKAASTPTPTPSNTASPAPKSKGGANSGNSSNNNNNNKGNATTKTGAKSTAKKPATKRPAQTKRLGLAGDGEDTILAGFLAKVKSKPREQD